MEQVISVEGEKGSTLMRAKTNDRQKQVECKVCLRKMRSDSLKRHMLTHRQLYSSDEDEEKIHNGIKRKKMNSCNDDNFVSLEKTSVLSSIDKNKMSIDDIRKRLLRNNELYILCMGKQINAIINEGVIYEESLDFGDRHALTMFRNAKVKEKEGVVEDSLFY